jgi:Tol biopolymer transport system component
MPRGAAGENESCTAHLNPEHSMDEIPPVLPRPEPTPAGDRLESWKEIAAYLKRDVTTVQRWEKREGMPVHRHVHDKSSSVYAFRTDLDAWTRSRSRAGDTSRSASVHDSTAVSPPMEPSGWRAVRSWWVVGIIAASAVGLAAWMIEGSSGSWSDPLAGARVTLVAGFEGTERAAALSRDGRIVAFLSDRDGQTDVWMTQVGTGEFHNLTRGRVAGLVNPSVRTIAFSPDGSLVTFWRSRQNPAGAGDIAIWAVPVLGGEPRPYLEGAAELDWSGDGSRLVYHTPGPGDPTYVSAGVRASLAPPIFTARGGQHAHYPLWSPRDAFIYFVQGSVNEEMDVWRIRPAGGVAERITRHGSSVSYPVMLDERTLLYLATDANGGGPWLYGFDVDRRTPHRLKTGVDTYTSLSASADGRRVAATQARLRRTLWRVPIDNGAEASTPVRLPLTTGRGTAPRYGPGYLLYVSSTDTGDIVWKLAGDSATQIWSAPGARVMGAAVPSPDGAQVAFCVEQDGRSALDVMETDGTAVRTISRSLALRGAPAWAPDGRSIVVPALDDGVTRLFQVSLDGGSVRLSQEFAVDPAWSPDGRFLVYSGPDVGTTFRVGAIAAAGGAYPLPDLTLTRGARAIRFLPGGRAFVVLRGEIQHKDLWLIDVETGSARQLTRLPADFHVRDFDISPDGREAVLDRVQDQSDIVLLDLSRR